MKFTFFSFLNPSYGTFHSFKMFQNLSDVSVHHDTPVFIILHHIKLRHKVKGDSSKLSSLLHRERRQAKELAWLTWPHQFSNHCFWATWYLLTWLLPGGPCQPFPVQQMLTVINHTPCKGSWDTAFCLYWVFWSQGLQCYPVLSLLKGQPNQVWLHVVTKEFSH